MANPGGKFEAESVLPGGGDIFAVWGNSCERFKYHAIELGTNHDATVTYIA
jgi:hypothetical protein